jgi:hypothetical protein
MGKYYRLQINLYTVELTSQNLGEYFRPEDSMLAIEIYSETKLSDKKYDYCVD